MARSKAKLSDKLERIMVQSQLMGLTTADMITIANRMKALDKERVFRREVDEACVGVSWEKKDKYHYIIKDSRGRVYECKRKLNSRDGWGYYSEAWEIKISHPGTRFEEKHLKSESINDSPNEAPSMCPDKDKRLWRLIRAIHSRRWG